MTEVSIVPCPEYGVARCRAALLEVLAPFGGLDWVRPGMKVAIKANLVSFLKPEAAATTHPDLLCALTELLKERGAEVIVGDSPGGLYTAVYVDRVYKATGMHQVEASGAVLNHNFEQKTAQCPEAKVAKTIQYTAYLDEADAIIDFSKLKTHGMMGMSNAAKNMFGVIPGTMKPEYHFRFPDPKDFARMIVDLDEHFKPVLSITDAIIGMEGNGPTNGTPRQIGAVLASPSPHKLDLACAKILGRRREDVPTLEAAFERGLIPETAEELDIAGNLEDFIVPDFKNLETLNSLLFRDFGGKALGGVIGGFVQSALCSVPRVRKGACVGCGHCRDICPAKAIRMEKKLPKINRKACIHWFCCQEFCPKGAMKVHRPIIAKILNQQPRSGTH